MIKSGLIIIERIKYFHLKPLKRRTLFTGSTELGRLLHIWWSYPPCFSLPLLFFWSSRPSLEAHAQNLGLRLQKKPGSATTEQAHAVRGLTAVLQMGREFELEELPTTKLTEQLHQLEAGIAGINTTCGNLISSCPMLLCVSQIQHRQCLVHRHKCRDCRFSCSGSQSRTKTLPGSRSSFGSGTRPLKPSRTRPSGGKI